MSYPRIPTDEEKRLIAEAVFRKPADQVSWAGVWMLTEYVIDNPFQYNCMGWSVLLREVISIPDRLDNLTYLYGHAIDRLGASADYVPATPNRVIQAWGVSNTEILHVTRYTSKAELQANADTFDLNLDFEAPAARGFPDQTWSSKVGIGTALIAHPENWLQGSIFPNLEQTYQQQ
ncbi:MAG TPA: hypothetical protein VFS20_25805 [Longimicrobium sp.]|nr:hypothetical protein [Longimicrobium sp.]